MMSVKIMVSTIIRNFHISAKRKTDDIPVAPEGILRAQGGIELIFKSRRF